jgi:hypothetical protein
MKKLVGILVVLLAISVAFSATITLKPFITGTLSGWTKLDNTGLTTDLGFTLKSLGFGATADVTALKFSLAIDLVGGTAALNWFTVENDKAAASWYANKSFGSDSGAGLGWFQWYGMTKSKTFVLNMKELGLQVATQEALIGGTDRIALYGAWDMFSLALQTGMAGLGWSGDIIAEAVLKPFAGLTLKAGLEAKDLTGAAVFDYVVDAAYSYTLGLLTLNPYARYASTKGQYVGLNANYGIGILSIKGGVRYDIANNKFPLANNFIEPSIKKDGIGYAGVKFNYEYDFAAATQAMKLGFLVKSLGWAAGPVALDAKVGTGDFRYDDGNGRAFGKYIYGDILDTSAGIDISAAGSAALTLAMGTFKPKLEVSGGYYFKDGGMELITSLGFPVFDLINFKAWVKILPAVDWYVKLYYDYAF